eukprot:14950496-Heterocapsa_arctica.AAC.1
MLGYLYIERKSDDPWDVIEVLCGVQSSSEPYALATVKTHAEGPDDEFKVMAVVRAIEEMGITSDLIVLTDKGSKSCNVARKVAAQRGKQQLRAKLTERPDGSEL